MTDFHFDLLQEPWIPCLTLDGKPCEVGIRQALLNAHQYQELYDNSPLVTVALLRLLLAILYRCWQPQDEEQWDEFWQRLWQAGRFPEADIAAYLNSRKDRFDLFQKDAPFFQTAHLWVGTETTGKNGKTSIKDGISSLSRLAAEIAAGNNATLFDHSCDEQYLEASPAMAARMLIGAQSFALGFGNSGRAKINEKAVSPPYTKDGPLIRGLTIWLTGDTLFETLLLNFFPYFPKANDRPIWERHEPYRLIFDEHWKLKKDMSAVGLLDRYTWQSRLIRLLPENIDGQIVVRTMYFTQGRILEKDDQEPMKAYRRNKQEGLAAIPLNEDKAAWRDAHTLLALGGPGGGGKRPEMINSVARGVQHGVLLPKYLCTAHAVGLATAPNKKGKYLLWRHERLPIPVSLLADTDLLGLIAALTEEAEQIARQMTRRFWKVCDIFIPETHRPPRKSRRRAWRDSDDFVLNTHRKDKDDVDDFFNALDPCQTFWPRLELHFHRLLLKLPDDEAQAITDWRSQVEQTANGSFQQACDRLGTSARALRAIAAVSPFFKIARLTQPETEPTVPSDQSEEE